MLYTMFVQLQSKCPWVAYFVICTLHVSSNIKICSGWCWIEKWVKNVWQKSIEWLQKIGLISFLLKSITFCHKKRKDFDDISFLKFAMKEPGKSCQVWNRNYVCLFLISFSSFSFGFHYYRKENIASWNEIHKIKMLLNRVKLFKT